MAGEAPLIVKDTNGDKLSVKSGGILNIESGGALQVAGTDRTAALATAPAGVAAGYKVAPGVHTTVDEDDTVVTGLATVVAVVACLASDPVAGCSKVTATVGNQAGAPAAGSIQIKSWEADETVGTTFLKLVNWIAVGT
jgi:hypothetical protein